MSGFKALANAPVVLSSTAEDGEIEAVTAAGNWCQIRTDAIADRCSDKGNQTMTEYSSRILHLQQQLNKIFLNQDLPMMNQLWFAMDHKKLQLKMITTHKQIFHNLEHPSRKTNQLFMLKQRLLLVVSSRMKI
uniref:Uncharacterized protein n=1 Tax=Timema genevievae TaxID=629358 RepID=A0A7R9PJ15_TIMGE|nr:unnamed protein product [Timema genevievae]